jgi:hypothetical protein
LATALLRVAPYAIDTQGEVDLRFELQDPAPLELLPSLKGHAAFEIKSMPGPYRAFDHQVDVTNAGGDASGMALDLKLESANTNWPAPGRCSSELSTALSTKPAMARRETSFW